MTTRTRMLLGFGIAVLVATAAVADDQGKTSAKKKDPFKNARYVDVMATLEEAPISHVETYVYTYYVGDLILPATDNRSSRQQSELDMTPMIDLITSTTARGTWVDASGKAEPRQPGQMGKITPFFLSLSVVVRQTEQGHAEVQDLLRKLRRLQEVQAKNGGKPATK